MKRVGSFVLELQLSDTAQAAVTSERSRKDKTQKKIKLRSWHKTCQQIDSYLSNPEAKHGAVGAVVRDARSKNVLARFSNVNLEAWSTEESRPSRPVVRRAVQSHTQRRSKKWDTIAFSSAHVAPAGPKRIYENRNVRDYHWELIEGANREVPFRLSYLERKAEQNPLYAATLYVWRLVSDCTLPFAELIRSVRWS